MPHILDFGAARFPDAICVADAQGRLTYRDTQRLTNRVANALRRVGLGRGDHSAILSLNHVNTFVAGLGSCRAGVAPLGVNALTNAREAASIVERNDIRWLFYHSAFEALASELTAQVASIRGAVCLDKESSAHASFTSWVADEADAWTDEPVREDDIIFVFTSGGTTGTPKGVLTRKRAYSVMAATFLACMPHRAQPRILTAVPISHGAGALARSFLAVGATNILLTRPDPELIMQTIERERITTLFLPPTVIYAMLAHPKVRDFDYGSLEYFLYSAAPMAPERLKEAIDVFGPVMCQTYGQAEVPIICTYFSREEHAAAAARGDKQRLMSCGCATPFVEMSVMDDAGRHLPTKEAGELVVRGDLVMAGYYKNDAANAEASAFGWHHTGDVGYRDEEGYYHIVDRKRDMIISGGFNIYPSEIEKSVLGFPGIKDCAVVGVPDAKWGEAVKAVVELRPGSTVDMHALVAHVRNELGSLKAPKSIDVCDALPRNAIGKVLRREVRERFWAGAERKV